MSGALDEHLLDAMPASVLIGRHDQRTCAILAGDEVTWHTDRLRRHLGDLRAGLGPIVALEQARTSILRATKVLDLVPADQRADPIVLADDHKIALLMTAAAELAAELADDTLAPLNTLSTSVQRRLTPTLSA